MKAHIWKDRGIGMTWDGALSEALKDMWWIETHRAAWRQP